MPRGKSPAVGSGETPKTRCAVLARPSWISEVERGMSNTDFRISLGSRKTRRAAEIKNGLVEPSGEINSGPHRTSQLRESVARRFDVLELQQQAKAEKWSDGVKRRLAFRVSTTGSICEAVVEVDFSAERFGGRRIWWLCPVCRRRARFLFGGRQPTVANRIACRLCQQLAYSSNREAPERRWRRQMEKLEHRLGGDPRKVEPPRGNARRTFDRLAARHEGYRQRVIAHREGKLQRRMRSRLWPTDPAEVRALREAHGLTPGTPTIMTIERRTRCNCYARSKSRRK